MSFDFPFVRLFGNFVITFIHNYYLANYRYTGLQCNYYLMVKKKTVAFQPSLNTVANLYTIKVKLTYLKISHISKVNYYLFECMQMAGASLFEYMN
jgi:hypothetical protein